MFNKGVFILLFFIFKFTIGEDTCTKSFKSNYEKLKNDLLCGYEKSIRPGEKKDTAVKVSVTFVLKYLAYDMYDHAFTIHNWVVLTWKDERLKWMPKDYNNRSSIHLRSDEIWVPDLSELNRSDLSGGLRDASIVNCLVLPMGSAVCILPEAHNGLCVPDLTYFPFDKQNCSINYGVWVHNSQEVYVSNSKLPQNSSIVLDNLAQNPEWRIISADVITRPPNSKLTLASNTLTATFVIQRENSIYLATIVIPAIILVMLVLTTTLMDIENPDRLRLGCFTLLCHFLYVQHLFWTIPPSGQKTPLVVAFFRDSMLLSSLLLVLTVIFESIARTQSKCPVFISNSVNRVTSYRIGKIITSYGYLDQAPTAVEDEESNKTQNITPNSWVILVKLFNSLIIFLYFIAYITLFVALIP